MDIGFFVYCIGYLICKVNNGKGKDIMLRVSIIVKIFYNFWSIIIILIEVYYVIILIDLWYFI